jgi:hypothetical protein
MTGVALALLMTWHGAAFAQSASEPPVSDAQLAEQERIDTEMRVLAGRQQWKGVDHDYRRLLELETSGAPLTYAQHMLGVTAAKNLGDISAALNRLDRAALMGETDEVRGLQTDFNARFGAVRLEIEARAVGSWTLEMSEVPFAPDARAALDLANSQLRENRGFTGRLPAGTYRLGRAEFVVGAGGNEVLIAVSSAANSGRPVKTAPAEGTGSTSHAAWLVRAGGGFGTATSPEAGSVQPPAARGFAPVVGLGGTWGTDTLEFGGLAAWRAMLGGSKEAGSQQIHMATIGAMIVWHTSDLVFEGGPLYGFGTGQSVGAADTAAAACSGGGCKTEEIRGGIRGGGAEVGARAPLFTTGATVAAIGLHAGALSDSARWYPWATATLTLTPSASNAKGPQ